MLFTKESLIDFARYCVRENQGLLGTVLSFQDLYSDWLILNRTPSGRDIVYIDLDGVVADFDKKLDELGPDLDLDLSPDERSKLIDDFCLSVPDFFQSLELMPGAYDTIMEISMFYDVYFLSTPMWAVPHSYTGKREWIETHFGDFGKKRLILTHRKDLNIGKYLIDDRIKNGVENFKGMHIHFGTEKFPDWEAVSQFFKGEARIMRYQLDKSEQLHENVETYSGIRA